MPESFLREQVAPHPGTRGQLAILLIVYW